MADWRNISEGRIITGDGYADQPYIVCTDDGAWLCCVTVSGRKEGSSDQHVATFRSTDQGLTWEKEVRVEEPGSPENSYAVMLKVPSGRVYIFYTRNSDNVRSILSHDRSASYSRVDSLGHYVFRFSDDNGKSWSKECYDIPFRKFRCDLNNVYGGELCFFWNVGRPFVMDGRAYLPLSKIGELGRGFFQQSEGALMMSDNILTETDPAKIRWATLPDGDIGLRTPPGGDTVAEEHTYVTLSDGSVCASYRSVDGYSVECYSRDGGHTWETPHYKRLASGTPAKNPRAANFIWKMKDGRYLYWFHNNGGHFIRDLWKNGGKRNPYDGRNPVWLCGGVEVDTPRGKEIAWLEPHIFLYGEKQRYGISYPDFWEEGGRFFVSETQKTTARVHEVPKEFIEGLFTEPKGTLLSEGRGGGTCSVPALPCFSRLPPDVPQHVVRLSFELSSSAPGRWINALDANGLGVEVALTDDRRMLLRWNEPERRLAMDSQILPQDIQSAEIVLDFGPCIAFFRCNGAFCDGGEERRFGWLFFDPNMQFLDWTATFNIDDKVKRFSLLMD